MLTVVVNKPNHYVSKLKLIFENKKERKIVKKKKEN